MPRSDMQHRQNPTWVVVLLVSYMDPMRDAMTGFQARLMVSRCHGMDLEISQASCILPGSPL